MRNEFLFELFSFCFPRIYDSLPSAPGKRSNFGFGGVGAIGGGGGGGPATARHNMFLSRLDITEFTLVRMSCFLPHVSFLL